MEIGLEFIQISTKRRFEMVDNKDEKRIKDVIEAMDKARGHSSVLWASGARKDADFMEAYNKLYGLGLSDGKALPVKTRELIAIGILAFRRSESVVEHMKRAIRYGATKQELLEAIETTIVPGGAPTFSTGLKALLQVEEDEKKGSGGK
jgi:alkylhydroperoxidase/carboxymuconolactone decarboxylase family protein YurZ